MLESGYCQEAIDVYIEEWTEAVKKAMKHLDLQDRLEYCLDNMDEVELQILSDIVRF